MSLIQCDTHDGIVDTDYEDHGRYNEQDSSYTCQSCVDEEETEDG